MHNLKVFKRFFYYIKDLKTYRKKLSSIPEWLARGGGERQVSPSLEGIREDHKGKYKAACDFVKKGDVVLDCASGVGYGAMILSTRTQVSNIIAIDKDKRAIKYAKRYYSSPRIDYRREDIFSFDIPDRSFDVIISFETLEHVDGAKIAKIFSAKIKKKGLLIISTPDQERLPFNSKDFPFHIRHYTSFELTELLTNNGFRIIDRFTQYDREREDVSEGWGGLYLIAVAEKE